MKAYGNVITGTVGAQGLDLPTQPAPRPAHWPAKRDRTTWTSPIARTADETATRRAEQAAAEAAAREAREKEDRDRKARHAKAAPAKPTPPAKRTPAAPVDQPKPPAQPRKIDDAEAVRLFTTEQRSIADIARHFGCSHPAVVQRLRKAGVYQPRPTKAAPENNGSHRAALDLRQRVETDLRALWTEGLPIWAIAVRLNVSETLVKRLAKEFDLPRRRKALDPDQVATLYAEHRSTERVAELLGTSGAAVRYQLQRAGVAPRTPGQRGDLTARDDEEASPAAAPTSRAQLLEALTLERFGPPPRRPRASPPRPAERPVWLDPLPDIARRRRELLEALDGRPHAEEATA